MIKRLFGAITMPPRPRQGMDALTFANGVYRALDQIKGLLYESRGGGRPSSSSVPCPFGELVPMTTGGFTIGIKGGVVYAGDKNFNVPERGINLASSGAWLIYLEIDVEANRDDDGEIILPGIKTSAETDPSSFWQHDAWSAGPPPTQYPDNTNPEVTDGLGTIIIPLGKLTVADGAATFERVDCGNVTIGQCAGILSHTRT